MSCGPKDAPPRLAPGGLFASLGDEGFRLFFPLAALYAACWPLLWILAFGFDLPLARDVPAGLWHAHEMIFGAFGAALIGFLTTAAPEWTDTEPLRGRPLWALAGLWASGRLVGALGWDGMGAIGTLADLAWLLALTGYLLHLSWRRRTDRLLAFVFWLGLLIACMGAARWHFLTGGVEQASKALHLAGFAFLGLLGLALARITVPVTNLILDPSEETAPFRPHPGRMNLAPGLVLIAMAGLAADLSPAVTGFLVCAAGAAFLDRMGEHFIGRAALQAEILLLAGATGLAGAGLLMTGAAMLGAGWGAAIGLHVAFMGGLGLGTYAVLCIAGKLHTGQPLGLSRLARIGGMCIFLGVLLRMASAMGLAVPGAPYALAALAWGLGFGCWLISYWPALRHSRLSGADRAAIPDDNDAIAKAETLAAE